MVDSKTVWLVKTIGLVIFAAVVTALLTTWLQQLIWDTASPGIAGGAAAGVAVAVAVSRRHALPQDQPKA